MTDDVGARVLGGAAAEFRKLRSLAERAVAQVGDEAMLFRALPPSSNSVAILVKHMGGNLRSRWTDFLAADGEKPWRERDREFVIEPADTWASLRERWDLGWDALLATLASLGPADLARTVRIRGEAHTVLDAIDRALTHAAYHTGQIVLLSRLAAGESWTWLSVPPGATEDFNREMFAKHRSPPA